jgi:hypothetical protein
MYNKFRVLFYVILLILIHSCDSRTIDRSGLKEEKANRALKKVSEAEILNEAAKLGQKIADEADQLLIKKSNNVLGEHITDPVRKANINWIHNMDSLENKFETEIKYLSLITSQKIDQISSIEAEILEAYQYNLENAISLTENIQKIEKNYLLYNKPIFLSSSSCLRCHGNPGEDIAENTLLSIQKNYPSSKIYGYSLGSVLGFWSILISQKKIVQDL